MALHIILGDGEMSKTELTKTLKDLWERAGDDPFWFIVQGKSAPTETDTNLVSWMTKNEVYFEVVTDDADAMDEIYGDAQETHVVKRLAQKIVNLLTTKPEDGEEADVLALFVSDDPSAEEDRWLNNVIETAMKESFKAYGLNDGLVEIDISGSTPAAEETEEEEESVAPAKPAKRAAKKVAAAPTAAPTAAPAKSKAYSRDDLEEMELDQLKEIAASKGIELAPRTRHATYINEILGESKDAPAVEVSQPPVTKTITDEEPSTNGFTVEDVANLVIEKLVKALQA